MASKSPNKKAVSSKSSTSKGRSKKPAKTTKTKSRTVADNKLKSNKFTSARAKAKASRSAKQSTSPAVALPSNMSQRAITKSLTYKAYFKKYASTGLFAFAGLCIAAGSALALYTSFNPTAALSLAQVCISGDCDSVIIIAGDDTDSTNTVVDENVEPTATVEPVITVLEAAPAEPTDDFPVSLRADFVSAVTIAFEADNSVLQQELTVQNTENIYRADISISSLPEGSYRVFARVVGSDATQIISIPLGQFRISPPEPATASESEAGTVSSELDPSIATTVEDPVTGLSADTADTETTESEESTALSISVSTPRITESAVLTVTAPTGVRFIEIYARRERSTNSTFLGLARMINSRWVYTLQASALPSARYEFFAQTTTESGVTNRSNIVSAELIQPAVIAAVESSPTASDETQARELLEWNTQDVDFEQAESNDTGTRVQITTATIVRDLFKTYRLDIDRVLKNYASAYQYGDVTNLTLAKEAITMLQADMMRSVLRNSATEPLASTVSVELAARFEKLLTDVEAFELARRDRLLTETTEPIDTDSDGITDYDETWLYNTDPNNPDTDGDGFLDGIEIMRGFDPLDSNAEVAIVYQTPKDSLSPVRDDVLVVERVTPIIERDESISQPQIQAEIVGTAIPHAFVTLYIFSTPIIVTVKADATGAYTYELEKELEDGTHEVYAAITDNTGSIVARSLPFTFIKEAEAFTPVAAETDATISETPTVEVVTKRAYSTTIGLAILAFGLLLLILGLGMKRTDESIVTVNESPA